MHPAVAWPPRRAYEHLGLRPRASRWRVRPRCFPTWKATTKRAVGGISRPLA